MTSAYKHSTHSLYVLALVGSGQGLNLPERTSKGYRTTMVKRGFIVQQGDDFELTSTGLQELTDGLAECSPDTNLFSEYIRAARELMAAVTLRCVTFPRVTEVVTS